MSRVRENPRMATGLEREVLLGPGLLARGASVMTSGRSVRWMLGQPRPVRRSYVEQVMDRAKGVTEEEAQQAWMLRQPVEVRESYIAQVLERRVEQPKPQVLWMLRQPDSVRDSYAAEVIGIPRPAPRKSR